MSSTSDLTGRWTGHYLQQGREYPITAHFTQDGEHLSGTMHDGHPDRESAFFEATAEAGLPPGADEQIEAQLRELVPDAPAGPIRYVSHLPTESVLEGRCDGRTVSFLKTYEGTSFGGYKVGERLVGTHKEGHAVHYEGRLSPDGLLIEGWWWIDPEAEHGTRRTEGYFTLRREEGSGLSSQGREDPAEPESRP
jgi:hypothetical protein